MFRPVPKISCSLLAARERNYDLPALVRELPQLGIEMIHFDISDQPKTLTVAELTELQPQTTLPFDVHLSASEPLRFTSKIRLAERDFFSLHVESGLDVDQLGELKSRLGCHFGLALNTKSSVDKLYDHASILDFTLFMAATAGVSGGDFDDGVVDKIRAFRTQLPDVPVHVDGGVNGASAALLRDVGVEVMISGSYIFKSRDAIRQVTRLLGRNLHLRVGDIMRSRDLNPGIPPGTPAQSVAEEIQRTRVGCACVVDESHRFLGVITDGDLRRRLVVQPDLSRVNASELMTREAFTTTPNVRLLDLLRTMDSGRDGYAVVPVLEANRDYRGLFYLQDLLLSDNL